MSGNEQNGPGGHVPPHPCLLRNKHAASTVFKALHWKRIFCTLLFPIAIYTDLLFGDDLQKHLKDIADQNKIGAKITPALKGTRPYAGKSHSGYNNYMQPKNWKGHSQRPWKHKGQGNRGNKAPRSSQ